ncbi:hypothetical protein HUO09_17635 [Vibrio sp. Y2-5]|uniref:hypothetical protein n=1 Tax=Vibrio sp. Y2-5 TaxID=2743977 RepID=UPI00166042D7|nr:hypothetical protein [Vibrio sp. Y2-5]MBD0788180.1 hypothetical protein [Vibrio sp. Y2-5]
MSVLFTYRVDVHIEHLTVNSHKKAATYLVTAPTKELAADMACWAESINPRALNWQKDRDGVTNTAQDMKFFKYRASVHPVPESELAVLRKHLLTIEFNSLDLIDSGNYQETLNFQKYFNLVDYLVFPRSNKSPDESLVKEGFNGGISALSCAEQVQS